jgi:hypothetical protein
MEKGFHDIFLRLVIIVPAVTTSRVANLQVKDSTSLFWVSFFFFVGIKTLVLKGKTWTKLMGL